MSKLDTPTRTIPDVPSDVDLDVFPSLVQYEGASEYCRKLGLEVAPRAIRRATENGELRSFIVSRRRHYAPAHVREWLLSREDQR